MCVCVCLYRWGATYPLDADGVALELALVQRVDALVHLLIVLHRHECVAAAHATALVTHYFAVDHFTIFGKAILQVNVASALREARDVQDLAAARVAARGRRATARGTRNSSHGGTRSGAAATR
jgi:hypothetical protein